ncbi:signal transduction histidine kinase [Micromonospora luteifusca]|uniref:histidine kinase n=1 Tax=Micromonospora luteifusca TaxID=709860 RepID=A0ABS2LX17_9ACTN|nr:sensor histidine kinase [Micromonospora luteifusca]MBM7492685.1 signal transduction histidine kinase [Micromonospora luteifusca]
MELVRNAYDADATNCHIRLKDASSPGGTLVVEDNGDGMTAEQLAQGFLLIGKSSKSMSTHTAGKRRRVGEKGLGRLAALRLGTRVTVSTRSSAQPGREQILSIDWDRIDSAEAVEDVPLVVDSRPSSLAKGTTVTINGLRDAMSSKDAERLARALLLLTGPFAEKSDFRVQCDAPEFGTIAKLMDKPPVSQFEFRLVATLDSEGRAAATLYNWRDEAEYTGDHNDVAKSRTGRKKNDVPERFFAPPATFEMWMFNLNPGASKKLRNVQQNTEEIKRWLRVVGGVHLYHRRLRVQPYGDAGNDWLGINLRRSSSPEVRPSTNTSVGLIQVADPDNLLRPKTDRGGFVDTIAFLDLQEFAKRALEWVAEQRLVQREQRRVGAAAKARDRVEEAESRFQNLIDAISPGDPDTPPLIEVSSPALIESFTTEAAAVFATQREEIDALREDLLLYRSLATVGTSTAVFAHEALRPAARIINEVKTVSRRVKKRVPPNVYEQQFDEPVEIAIESARTLETFAKLPLSLLEKKKREIAEISVDVACSAMVALFSRYLDERSIKVDLDLGAPQAKVRTTIADIESILSNLLANAAHAFTRMDAADRERLIRIRTRLVYENAANQIVLTVDDSGPGIDGISLKAIWLPGKTTRDNGTGLGLTIVRDIVADLKGRNEARRRGELGGARIMVWLPTKPAEGEAPHEKRVS